MADIMRQRQHTLMPCYGQGLEEDDTLQGAVKMAFGVARDGHVAIVRVTGSTLRHRGVEDCFVEIARRWRFPQAAGGPPLRRFETSFRFVYE